MSDVVKLLTFMSKSGIFPGNGKKFALLVREMCEKHNLNEDDFLPNHIKREKGKWGL